MTWHYSAILCSTWVLTNDVQCFTSTHRIWHRTRQVKAMKKSIAWFSDHNFNNDFNYLISLGLIFHICKMGIKYLSYSVSVTTKGNLLEPKTNCLIYIIQIWLKFLLLLLLRNKAESLHVRIYFAKRKSFSSFQFLLCGVMGTVASR